MSFITPDDPRYKTEQCRNFTKDFMCPFEEDCPYSHGPVELRINPRKKTIVCSNGDECTYGTRCHFIHEKQSCPNINTYGACIYGSRCGYLHDSDDYDDHFPAMHGAPIKSGSRDILGFSACLSYPIPADGFGVETFDSVDLSSSFFAKCVESVMM